MRAPGIQGIVGFAVVLALSGVAEAGPGKSKAAVVDIDKVKAELVVLSDGQGHFMVVKPNLKGEKHLYYGDGKTFHAQRVWSGSSDGARKRFSQTYWAPRANGSSIELKDGVWRVTCDKRVTVLSELPPKETRRMLDSATFHAPLWRHRAYAMARDRRGTYYYVDRLQDRYGGRGFRLWVGQRGAMKRQKMINIVSDSEGDIFATKSGDLRLILDRKDATWVRGKRETRLTYVPPARNAFMIYAELGVYTGRLGTPCDDL